MPTLNEKTIGPLVSADLIDRRLFDFQNTLKHDPELAEMRELPALIPGAHVYLVGGSVRDALMGGKPKDYDLMVTGATTDEVAKALASFPNAKAEYVGKTFPVFVFRGGENRPQLDVALARVERTTGGGGTRDFEVEASKKLTAADDLGRRDFTWNAMAIDLTSGELVDPYHGRDDLLNGLIRAVGNPLERFAEDRTRALRGLRFAAKLGFQFDEATWEAIKVFANKMNEKNPAGEYIAKRETVGKEFARSFDANPVRTLELYDMSGMLAELFPEIEILKKIQQRPDYHPEGDNFTHTKLALTSLPADASTTAKFAVLFHDLGKATKFQVFDRSTSKQMALTKSPADFCTTDYNPARHLIKNIDHEMDSREIAAKLIERYAMTAVQGFDADRILYIVREHMFHGVPQWKLGKIEKILFTKEGEPIWDLYAMARADACGSHNNQEFAELVKKHIESLLALREEQAKQPPKLIDGTDVMREKNLKPGPEIKKILEAVRERQLEELAAGRAFTREDALDYLRSKT